MKLFLIFCCLTWYIPLLCSCVIHYSKYLLKTQVELCRVYFGDLNFRYLRVAMMDDTAPIRIPAKS